MAQYVKLRLRAAKVSVSMALLAAIAGMAEKAQASADHPKAKAAVFGYIKLTGLSSTLKYDWLKIEAKVDKLFRDVATLQRKDRQFLKIKTANNEFVKIKTADSEFASVKLLNSEFLKIDDANIKFLKIDGTAADSNKLGGMTADQFIQGSGGVVSSGILIGLNQPSASLLQTPDGRLAVAISANANDVTLNFTNSSGGALDALATDSATTGAKQLTLKSGQTTTSLPGGDIPHQYHLQVFPGATSKEALTLMLSVEPSRANPGQLEVVGQLLVGTL